MRELDRLGALTGVADTSGKKQDIYFCHDFCELGAVPAEQVFHDIDDFLSRNLTDVVVIDIEDYVQPKDLKQALIDAGLFDRVWKPSPKQIGCRPCTTWWRRTRSRSAPADRDEREAPWRLSVAVRCVHVSQESPFTFTSIAEFNCNPNRGGNDKSFFILNHWLRPDGPPDPVAAAKVNSQKMLTPARRSASPSAGAPQRGRGRLHRDR